MTDSGSDNRSVSNLLSRKGILTDQIALYKDRTISGRDFISDVFQLHSDVIREKENRWAIYFDDSYEFIVAFLAVIHAGKTAILLPNVQLQFLEELHDQIDIIITNRELAVEKTRIFHFEPNQTAQISTDVFQPLDPEKTTIELFTSGSTGRPKKFLKKLRQLEMEVEALEKIWKNRFAGATVFASVSHQHIYGLLFKALWPLFANRAFCSMQMHFPQDLLAQVSKHKAAILVSSPVYLSMLPKLLDLNKLSGSLAGVFSSGGPLKTETALAFYENSGIEILEVFGSTDTGGISYRSQTEAEKNTRWKLFPGVNIKVSPERSALMVNSPYAGVDGWFETEDIVRICDNNDFELIGRADKIVKIAEKRVSLIEMEERLSRSDMVSESVLTVLEDNRQYLGAIVVLSENGRIAFQTDGKRLLARRLKSFLGQYFEAVVLPKKWRFVESLRYNQNGKLLMSEVKKLFEKRDDQVVSPKVKSVRTENSGIILYLHIPADLLYFKGHFTDNPVLPGVAQVDWAIKLARKYIGIPGGFAKMSKLKFHQPILPDSSLELTLNYQPEKETLTYSFKRETVICSSGAITFS